MIAFLLGIVCVNAVLSFAAYAINTDDWSAVFGFGFGWERGVLGYTEPMHFTLTITIFVPAFFCCSAVLLFFYRL